MNDTTVIRSTSVPLFRPAAAAAVGVVTFGLSVGAGEMFELNANPDQRFEAQDLIFYVISAAVGVAIAVAVGMWAWRGSPGRLAGAALGLALGAVATCVVFWSGWPIIFGAVAVGSAAEHRRRLGSFSGMTIAALVLGALAFVAAAYVCVTG